MAPHPDLWARSAYRATIRRGVILAAIGVSVLLVVWYASSQNLVLVALTTAPAGAIGIVLARDRPNWRTAEGGGRASGWDAFKREIDRSRRHERPVALAVASLPAEGSSDFRMAGIIARVQSQLRSIDVLWCDDSRLWVLMPESNRDGGTTALRRIIDAAPATMNAVWRLVVFPDDAITVGALMAELVRAVPVDPAPPESPAP